jgi:hypothetical protein
MPADLLDHPEDAPFVDDEERAESAWLLARDDHPTASAPSPRIASDYAEIEALLHELPSGHRDDTWHAAVLAAAGS